MSKSVSAQLRHWLLTRATSLAPRTIESYTSLIDLHIDPAIGDIALDELKSEHISQMLYDIWLRGHTRTAELCYVVLSLALRGTDAGAVMVQIPRPLHRAVPPSWWSAGELRAYLAASRGQWRLCWLLALCCGLRRGELAGLRWCDVDLDAKLIRIRNQRQNIKKRGIIDGPPKSKSGIRDIPIPDALVDELMTAQLLACADRLIGLTVPYVLRGITNGGVSPSSIDHAHRDQLARSGVRSIPLHGMRHTMASLAIATGTDTRILQTLLGHAQITTTAQIYAHVITSAQRNAIDCVTSTVLQ